MVVVEVVMMVVVTVMVVMMVMVMMVVVTVMVVVVMMVVVTVMEVVVVMTDLGNALASYCTHFLSPQVRHQWLNESFSDTFLAVCIWFCSGSGTIYTLNEDGAMGGVWGWGH